jgi:hypothetical protein
MCLSNSRGFVEWMTQDRSGLEAKALVLLNRGTRGSSRLIGTGSPVVRVGISRQKGWDIPLRYLGIPMGSNGILACKSFR